VLSRIGGSGKTALVQEEGNRSRKRERERVGWGGGGQESKVSTGSAPDPRFWHQILGKILLTKKAHEKISCPRTEFNGRLELPGWQGKDSAAQILGQVWFL
jgi:hypothetical protein